MKIPAIITALLAVAVAVHAQTPPQFTSLPSDSNDYTCLGLLPCATWPMIAQPAPGTGALDSVYGTTAYQLSNPAMPIYSRVQSWNADESRMLTAIPGSVQLALWDATTTPPTYINKITLSDGTFLDGVDNDVLWAFTDKNRIYFGTGASSVAHGLQLRYVDVSTCTTLNCTLTPVVVHTFSCTTDATSSLGAGVAGNKIETGSGAQGGMFDNTDTYFSFTCDRVDVNGRHEIDMIRYNRSTDTVTTQVKWYTLCPGGTPSGCKAYQAFNSSGGPIKDGGLIRMNQHPDQRFITIIWQTNTGICPTLESKWVRSCGTEVFDASYNYLGGVSSCNTHQDVGFDINGQPIWIGASYKTGGPIDGRRWHIVDLTKVSPTALTGTNIAIPATYNYNGSPIVGVGSQKPWHISMQANGTPGWALLSTFMYAGQDLNLASQLPKGTTLGTAVTSAGVATVTPASMTTIGPGVTSLVDFGNTAQAEWITWTSTTSTTATATFTKTHASTAPVQCISCGNTGYGAMEMLAVKVDSLAADGSNATIYRIGRTRDIDDNSYNCESHATASRFFDQILYASSWDQRCFGNAQVGGYWIHLAASTPPSYALSTATVGSGNFSPCAGAYLAGAAYSCTVTPSTGWTLASVTGCGGTLSGSTYSGNMPGANCTITATFNPPPTTYQLTASWMGNGYISGCAASYIAGATFNCTILPIAPGSLLAIPISTCGPLTQNGTIWSGTMPAGPCSVSAVFSTAPGMQFNGGSTIGDGVTINGTLPNPPIQ